MPDRKNIPDLKLRECPFCGGMDQHIEIDRRLYFDYEIIVISEVGSEKLDSEEIFEEIISLLHCYSMKMYSSRKAKKKLRRF